MEEMIKLKLFDILSIFKKNKIKLIEKIAKTEDSYLFSFENNQGIEWKPGQHGMFQFQGEKLEGGNFRPFSVASTDKENKIMILTKIGDNPSGFKQRLKSMEIGEPILLRGPFGGSYISDYNKPICMIAGGTGITPMRAMLKSIEENKELKYVELLYIDSSGQHAFVEDLERIEGNNSKIKVIYIKERSELEEKLFSFISKYDNSAIYFISGTPKMVTDIRDKIMNKNIKRKNIITEHFRGYKGL